MAHIACENGGQPYVTPSYLPYDSGFLYGAAMMGRKIEWMRANPRVSVSVEDMIATYNREWASVVVSARYQELPDEDAFRGHRKLGISLMSQNTNWWEPSYIRKSLSDGKNSGLVIFRLEIEEMTGHFAMREETIRSSERYSAGRK